MVPVSTGDVETYQSRECGLMRNFRYIPNVASSLHEVLATMAGRPPGPKRARLMAASGQPGGHHDDAAGAMDGMHDAAGTLADVALEDHSHKDGGDEKGGQAQNAATAERSASGDVAAKNKGVAVGDGQGEPPVSLGIIASLLHVVCFS
jgi:hypothetical protein